MAEPQATMPSGWDCRLDSRTGKFYFINHHTKTTTWDDPRGAKQHHKSTVEYIPLQLHGSPEFRRNYVYPSQTTPKRAFQAPPQTMQETSFDDPVVKIAATFPTVSDSHIRQLLKKYHNREALVISALQVEKHPISTPGPYATPPPTRTAVQTSSAASPRPTPHSPKLKLRYMKSLYPKAEEVLILDLLTGNDNNIQKVSEALKDMGFERRDSVVAKPASPSPQSKKPEETHQPPPPVVRTMQEKKSMVSQLQVQYRDVPEPVVALALESVDFDPNRAGAILNGMLQDERHQEEEPDSVAVVEDFPKSQSRQSLKSFLKTDKSDYSLDATFSRVIENDDSTTTTDVYRSANLSSTRGADRRLVKGPNHRLLLEDYVKWHGPEPRLAEGPGKSLAKGPDVRLRMGPRPANGANADLRKGPKAGLVFTTVAGYDCARGK